MKEHFVEKNFSARSLLMIANVNSIIDRYAAMGYDLTVRQIFYQLVSQNIFANTSTNYKNLGGLISDARLAGLIDWFAIKDRARFTYEINSWDDLKGAAQHLANNFKLDKWKYQPNYIEVQVEKQALEGVLAPVCSKFEVPFTSTRGYASQSILYTRAKNIHYKREVEKKRPIVIYLGDHDPSGIDMSRNLQERLELLSNGPVEVIRVALNMDQVQHYELPENPVKDTDSRTPAYEEEFGSSCWELDAVSPDILAELVSSTITKYRHEDLWMHSLLAESALQDQVQDFVDSI